MGLPNNYPRQNDFYRDLQKYCDLVRHFPASSDRLGPDVWIYAVTPQTREILNDRGSLTRGFYEAHMSRIRRNDLYSFLGFTGELARQRGDWPSADLYLGTLLDLRPDIRKELLLTVAFVKYKAGRFTEAAQLCAELLQHRPGDPKALALAAAIVEDSAGAHR